MRKTTKKRNLWGFQLRSRGRHGSMMIYPRMPNTESMANTYDTCICILRLILVCVCVGDAVLHEKLPKHLWRNCSNETMKPLDFRRIDFKWGLIQGARNSNKSYCGRHSAPVDIDHLPFLLEFRTIHIYIYVCISAGLQHLFHQSYYPSTHRVPNCYAASALCFFLNHPPYFVRFKH